MRQLIETDQRNLRALPIQLAAFVLQVGKLHFPAARPLPQDDRLRRHSTRRRVELHRLVPQPARIAHLRRVATEEHRREFRLANVVAAAPAAAPKIPSASSSAIDGDVCRARQETLLRPQVAAEWLFLAQAAVVREIDEDAIFSPSPSSSFIILFRLLC